MTLRQVISTVAWAAILGFLVALPLGQQRQVSVELWLLAVTVWLGWTAFGKIIAVAPAVPARFRSVWRWPQTRRDSSDDRPRELVTLEGLVLSARDNPRSHRMRLQPRLAALASHHLRLREGIDIEREPERAAAVLGRSAWLIDPEAGERDPERAPTLPEINEFMTAVLGENEPFTDPSTAR